MSRKPLNLDWHEIHAEYVRENLTLLEIAKRHQCNNMTVSRKFEDLGLKKNPPNYGQTRLDIQADWHEWHCKWLADQVTLRDIADAVGCSKGVVQKRFTELGLPPKKQGKPSYLPLPTSKLPEGGNMNEFQAIVDYSTCQVVVYASQANDEQKAILEKSGMAYCDEADTPVGQKVGAKIKHARIHKKWLLHDLAEQAEIEGSRLFAIESELRNDEPPITFGELSRIAEALGRTLDSFTNGRVPGYWFGEWCPAVADALETLKLSLEPDKAAKYPDPDGSEYLEVLRHLQRDCEELYTKYCQAQALLKAIAFSRPTNHLPDPGDNLPNLRKRITFAVGRLVWYQLKNPRHWLGCRELADRYKMAYRMAERVAQRGRKVGSKWLVTPAEVWLWERENSLRIGSQYPLGNRQIALR